MGNCLETKLKSSVNNPNLIKLGERKITVTVPETESPFKMTINYAAPSQLRISGSGDFLTSEGVVIPGKSIDISTPNVDTDFYLSSGTYDLIIDSYKIRVLSNLNSTYVIDYNKVDYNYIYQYSYNLNILEFRKTKKVNCDVNKFFNKDKYPELYTIYCNGLINPSDCEVSLDCDLITKSNMQKVRMLNFTSSDMDTSKVKGNIGNVNLSCNLVTAEIYVRNSAISGEFKDVLDYMVSEGETGSVIFMGNSIVTLNGTAVDSGTTKRFRVTPNGWTEI